MSEPEIIGFEPPLSSNVNVVSRLPAMIAKRASLLRQLKAVDRDIAWLERKQALAEFVAADRINSARTDIPTLTEVLEWDGKFRAEYKAQHQARNAAILASTHSMEGPTGMPNGAEVQSVDELFEQDAAIEAPLAMDVDGLSELKGDGFEAALPFVGMNDPKISILVCPHTDPVKSMPWWSGVYQRIGLL